MNTEPYIIRLTHDFSHTTVIKFRRSLYIVHVIRDNCYHIERVQYIQVDRLNFMTHKDADRQKCSLTKAGPTVPGQI